MNRDERHRRGVAVHEAGHALMCRLLDIDVETVTIEWSGTSHGALIYSGTPPPESLLVILLAGETAVARADESGWFEQATDMAYSGPGDAPGALRVTSDAENIKAVLEQLAPGDPEAQERVLMTARERVDAEVTLHWELIALVANALLRKTTLSGRDVRRIIEREA